MAYSADTAFERFTEAGQTYGGFISHPDVEYILQINEDLPKSGIDGAPLIEVLERRQWELLRRFDLFKSMMLEEYAMLLVNVRGQGYRIANPNEHAEIAATSFADDVGKAVKNSRRVLEHVGMIPGVVAVTVTEHVRFGQAGRSGNAIRLSLLNW